MRDALSSLTVRGRTFLAGGITALVCALVLGQDSLARLGALVILLPVASAYVLSRSRHRLVLRRTVEPQVVVAGEPALVRLVVTNEARTATGTLLLEEVLPYALGARPRFVLNSIAGNWDQHLTYPVRPEVRGRHAVGPLTIRVTDPFGLVELGRTFQSTTPLVAVPRTIPLSVGLAAQTWAGSGHSRPRSFSVGHAEDVTVREYRQGDDMRRVHWPTSARTEELMVRREEQPLQARAVLVLDNRAVAHGGRGLSSSFETAVVVAASIVTHLVARGHRVTLASATGSLDTVLSGGTEPARDAAALLESLADVELTSERALDLSWLRNTPTGTQVIAVLGGTTAADHRALARLERHGRSPRAVVLDVGGWRHGALRPSEETDHDTVALLTASGWRAGLLGRTDSLDRVWQQVAR
ncbi:DUF58 domain-containing protein [Nocardioides gilvus]|uniref:DUF58 domain-containing protein n=1 Tax=Nocardioides gilvus TaxID=1735589 RepID=UPI000D7491B3|nr:DUF58 domain-containing protein [Nocardioides gilvus]